MARFISSKNTISDRSLKRRVHGAVVLHHYGRVDVRFTRVHGGWKREREDVTSVRAEVVSSATVARECNTAMGCKESWAKVY